jgi:Domain of unknown function (DUF4062)
MSTTGWARSTGRDSVPGGGVIWTPDQRLRVFVSSTLRELAAERQAVRDAVTSLRLVPVMFELGARPHPPRDVYRAYGVAPAASDDELQHRVGTAQWAPHYESPINPGRSSAS